MFTHEGRWISDSRTSFRTHGALQHPMQTPLLEIVLARLLAHSLTHSLTYAFARARTHTHKHTHTRTRTHARTHTHCSYSTRMLWHGVLDSHVCNRMAYTHLAWFGLAWHGLVGLPAFMRMPSASSLRSGISSSSSFSFSPPTVPSLLSRTDAS